MAKLVIKNFSCIDDAEIDLTNLTLLIGPQASGKSVVAKLVYFFQEIIVNKGDLYHYDSFSKEQITKNLDVTFKQFFPFEAWGTKKFSLFFEAGGFGVRIERHSTTKKNFANLTFHYSDAFEEWLRDVTKSIDQAKLQAKKEGSESNDDIDFLLSMRVGNKARESFQKMIGKEENLETQFYIPAGRSFFTTLGKSFAIAEHARLIDPIAIRFGKFLSYLRDKGSRSWNKSSAKRAAYHKDVWQKLMGGELVIESDEPEHFMSADGRKVPISFLSSGQQELMPLWYVLTYIYTDTYLSKNRFSLFVEEPETHLFPDAQAVLIEHIAFHISESSGCNLITTHSPYILAQVNNLMKAGLLAERLGAKAEKKISKIVPKEAWLSPGMVSAYRMENGRAVSLIDKEYGIMDMEYLDAVSEKISSQFSDLLDIEYPDVRK